jgi:hypothetical protein
MLPMSVKPTIANFFMGSILSARLLLQSREDSQAQKLSIWRHSQVALDLHQREHIKRQQEHRRRERMDIN